MLGKTGKPRTGKETRIPRSSPVSRTCVPPSGGFRPVPVGTARGCDLKFRDKGAQPQKVLKMKEPPGMCMKTKESMTKCPAKNRLFSRKCTNRAPIDNNLTGFLPANAAIARLSRRSVPVLARLRFAGVNDSSGYACGRHGKPTPTYRAPTWEGQGQYGHERSATGILPLKGHGRDGHGARGPDSGNARYPRCFRNKRG